MEARGDKTSVIAGAFGALLEGNLDSAAEIIRSGYPFNPPLKGRSSGVSYAMRVRVFVRDGFIDRYTGRKVVFPPVLRVLSLALPETFPHHPNWKVTQCHPAYWQLSATVDHVVPSAHGGGSEEGNLVTATMQTNAAKSDLTLEELGWSVLPAGDIQQWDGLMRWFLDYTAKHPEVLQTPDIRRWHKAVLLAQ